ncbi:MAG: hypothetical protein A3B70_07530 [Deltaproteobacteria bacterium RIFCSPHIGHO2_02_FULL_40_11]|nr:MAG: hypothetical protein A3B70_07530 [Deltaproteobacteria bacterium RIFCSPHIGHO2_02_FULL_40_11]
MSGLNPQQEIAVNQLDGPLLIIAGAGSGKTRVLTHRIANLISQKKAKPHEILAVTFTNKAAKEMRTRVWHLLGSDAAQNLWVNTFHATCVKILRKEIPVLGSYTENFVIYDDQDQVSFIKQCFRKLNIDPDRLSPKAIQGKINRAKNKGVLPRGLYDQALSSFDEKSAEIYEIYQQEMQKANALDFGDLLMLTVHIFKNHETVLKKYQDQFKYCLVDEYQDTNHVQYLLMKYLAGAHENICVVGDEDQSIYSWRGADISNILSFENDFPKAKVIKLEQNYRSTQNIIEASSHIISNNRSRKPKKLWTQNPKGTLIGSVTLEDEYHEARFVVGEILRCVEAGASLKDFAIFYRTNAQSRVFEEILRQNNVLYQIYGGTRFYNRSEVKDVLGYFRLISNPKDDVSFLRVINTPARGIGKSTIQKISYLSKEKNLSLYETTQKIQNGDLFNSGTLKKLRSFVDLMEKIQKEKGSLSSLYHAILDETRYVESLKEDGSQEALNRIENLEELNAAIGEFQKRNPKGTLEQYLEEISLISDMDSLDESDEFVKLMTLHSAKGLEFPSVFMVGVEEGLFPHSQKDWNPDEMEEERRLCYVGMTRAKEHLYLTHARLRRLYGAPQYNLPSRFLDEIPREYLQELDLRRKVKPQSSRARRARDLPEETSPNFDDDFNQDPQDARYKTGVRVRHPSFGSGVICRVEGQEASTKVTIKFQNGAVKKFLASLTALERV